MKLLAKEMIVRVNEQVYARFPQIEGARPALRRAPTGANVILTYCRQGCTADGFNFEQVVRVTVTPAGQIVKLSASR